MEKNSANPPVHRIVELDNPELPIACPGRETPVIFMHPRVWLTPDAQGTCRCPYCGTLYIIRSLLV